MVLRDRRGCNDELLPRVHWHLLRLGLLHDLVQVDLVAVQVAYLAQDGDAELAELLDYEKETGQG